MKSTRSLLTHFALLLTFTLSLAAHHNALADEGMWLFTDPPIESLQQKYGFTPSAEWLDHLQKSSIRFNNGGSGSFVSSNGLVMTNHHVAIGEIQKLSTAQRDLVENGFLARTLKEELKCHQMELNVLMEIEDVTEQIADAVEGLDAEKAHLARRAAINTIQKESLDATGLRSDVVTLYGGAVYHLYRYKKYTDVRLVFAPEGDIAFFGGDVDNFEYPRWDLDVTFFRVYEDGKPLKTEHFLKWQEQGVSDNELVFVSGHPGRTERDLSVAHLEFLRDRDMPERLDHYRRLEVLYNIYSDRSPENARRALRSLRGIENGRKCYLGVLAGAQTPALIAKKREDEHRLLAAVQSDPKLAAETESAFQEIDSALKTWGKVYDPLRLYEFGMGFNSTLYSKAKTLVRMADELQKPNAERLPSYSDANLESLEAALFSTEPIYKDFEQVKLADSLSFLLETLGADDPLVQQILDGKSPRARAAELVSGTRLDDPQYRRTIREGGKQAIEQSTDPMIQLALMTDPTARAYRTIYDEQIGEPLRNAYAKLTHARFATNGSESYPDATFTLRLSYGVVKGFDEDGQSIPPWTTINGAFQHAAEHNNKPPFQLPASWVRSRNNINPDTPLNFICTNDIIGGNSGSPVVNRQGEAVGLIFDGNIHSLSWKHVFDDTIGRSVAVDVRGITEALRKIYDAGFLADELGQ